MSDLLGKSNTTNYPSLRGETTVGGGTVSEGTINNLIQKYMSDNQTTLANTYWDNYYKDKIGTSVDAQITNIINNPTSSLNIAIDAKIEAAKTAITKHVETLIDNHITQHNIDISTLSKAIEENKKAIESHVAQHAQDITNINKEITEIKTVLDGLDNKYLSKNEFETWKTTEYENLVTKVDTNTKEIETIKEKIDNIDKSIEDINNTINTTILSPDGTNWNDVVSFIEGFDISSIEIDITQMKEDIENIKIELDEKLDIVDFNNFMTTEYSPLVDKVNNMDVKVQEIETKLTEVTDKVTAIEEKILELATKEEVEEVDKKVDALDEKLTALEKKHDDDLIELKENGVIKAKAIEVPIGDNWNNIEGNDEKYVDLNQAITDNKLDIVLDDIIKRIRYNTKSNLEQDLYLETVKKQLTNVTEESTIYYEYITLTQDDVDNLNLLNDTIYSDPLSIKTATVKSVLSTFNLRFSDIYKKQDELTEELNKKIDDLTEEIRVTEDDDVYVKEEEQTYMYNGIIVGKSPTGLTPKSPLDEKLEDVINIDSNYAKYDDKGVFVTSTNGGTTTDITLSPNVYLSANINNGVQTTNILDVRKDDNIGVVISSDEVSFNSTTKFLHNVEFAEALKLNGASIRTAEIDRLYVREIISNSAAPTLTGFISTPDNTIFNYSDYVTVATDDKISIAPTFAGTPTVKPATINGGTCKLENGDIVIQHVITIDTTGVTEIEHLTFDIKIPTIFTAKNPVVYNEVYSAIDDPNFIYRGNLHHVWTFENKKLRVQFSNILVKGSTTHELRLTTIIKHS